MNADNKNHKSQGHSGRQFRGKRLKTSLPRPAAAPDAAAAGEIGRAHRQGDGARRALLAARG